MKLDFRFDWVDPEGARGQELAATWAGLEILVGDRIVTESLSLKTKTIRSTVFMPLYPLAEWFAKNWWFVQNEPFYQGWKASSEFSSRHNIRFGAEGFSLPDLAIAGSGEHIALDWSPRSAGPLEFNSRGTDFFEKRDVIEPLRNFVLAVVNRLTDLGITGTFLQDEWRRVEASMVDLDELDFVGTSASIGVDPYSVSDDVAGRIIAAAGGVPHSLREEFFAVATLEQLDQSVHVLADTLAVVQRNGSEVRAFRDLPALVAAPREMPWTTGYRWADELFKEFRVDLSSLDQLKQLRNRLGVFSPDVMEVEGWTARPFDAVYAPDRSGGTVVAVRPSRAEAKLFSVCRVIGDYVGRGADASGLVTPALTARQKRNRAFAAELLAPAEFLRSRVHSEFVSEEVIEDIAAMLQVSPSVVGHQIKNHRIAETVS